jgi:hypothetical protein
MVLKLLFEKYDEFIVNTKDSLANDDFSKITEIVIKLFDVIIITYEKDEEISDFIKNKIQILPEKIIILIFKKIVEKINSNDEDIKEEEDDENEDIANKKTYKSKVEIIFDGFAQKVENNNDINKIINLLDCLKEQSKLEEKFLGKIIKNNLFFKEEFFSNKRTPHISLLTKLILKRKIVKCKKEYFMKLEMLLDEIWKELNLAEDEKIKERVEMRNYENKMIEEFLKNDESIILERLSLINLVLLAFNPSQKLYELNMKFK